MWQICQGYNTSISHIGTLIYSFDFAYGSGNLEGTSGCWNDFSGSKGKTVVAPAAGTIAWIGSKVPDMTCLKLKNVVANGHGSNIYSVMLGHMKTDNNRVVSGSVSQGDPLGILCDADECVKDGGYAHVHMSAYTSDDCGNAKKDTSVPFGTVFGPGYDFSSDRKWYGTEIPSDGSTCPSGNGAYCGSIDSSLNDNALYYCQDGNYQALEQCSYGCEAMPSGTNDRCSYGANPSLRAVYRFWSDQNQSHFYTISESERDKVIENYTDDQWLYEGVAWYSYITQEDDSLPVYRFWSDKNQSHFYTIYEDEKKYVYDHYDDYEWKYEGIEWYAYDYQKAGTIPVYRFWSDQKQSHFYTASESEKDYVIATYPPEVWRYEGIAWHVFQSP